MSETSASYEPRVFFYERVLSKQLDEKEDRVFSHVFSCQWNTKEDNQDLTESDKRKHIIITCAVENNHCLLISIPSLIVPELKPEKSKIRDPTNVPRPAAALRTKVLIRENKALKVLFRISLGKGHSL